MSSQRQNFPSSHFHGYLKRASQLIDKFKSFTDDGIEIQFCIN